MNRPGPRRGYALVGTMAFLVLLMIMWIAAFGQVAGYLRSAKACDVRQDRSTGPTRALACGLALLETGVPAESPYSCRITPSGSETYVLTFTEIGSWEYRLSVRAALPEDDSLPSAPEQFANGPSQPPAFPY